ncbi:hypothetical protein CHGG_03697 [Chaetomium globosum CBS 148.51]|uniref:DNA 3'-5' helicase n=1 Tax=Chaetomium globosum (strain ATCC 6205 / CBS 148.51 / DSM 1962 / NBRC 6347 / NRRL 1970) TaxID=306901 RepID=Q2H7V7_CHAGB|nr:uncharacterized protein CHGG_03697 [Chaetomium globosum CBS 148.51]EAQ91762.1 hypothetical protein CHGG_03697 [Chaetomium globosum CBS 148.51]
MAVGELIYNAEHRVVVCRPCGTCLVPDGQQGRWENHLRKEPHRLKGDRLKRMLDVLSKYELRGRDELKRQRPSRRRPCEKIAGLASYGGYLCACDVENCDFATTRLSLMHDHMPRHGRTASQHTGEGPLWRSCTLQTYFTARQLVDYFVVVEPGGMGQGQGSDTSGEVVGGLGDPPPSSPERRMFDGLREDIRQADRDLDAKAAVVEDPGEGRADRERWLIYTGFPTHLRGLSDAEIESSFRPPKSTNPLLKHPSGRGGELSSTDDDDDDDDDDDGDGDSDHGGDRCERDLRRILEAADTWLWKANDLVADGSMQRRMTHQRAQTLSDFAAGAGKKGRDIAFRCFKRAPTLVAYFRRMKELLTYYYRVVYREDGHFTRGTEAPAPTLPRDIIEPTQRQRDAMDEIHRALRRQDEKEKGVGNGDGDGDGDDEGLEAAIREFYVALICQTVGSAHFRSPVISFCAMLSRTKRFSSGARRGGWKDRAARNGTGDDELDEAARRRRKLRCWHDPGNYSSTLSALIWSAQLVLFESVCFRERDDEDRIPAALARICEEFMHQKGETTFGHILQWRLYLTTVASSAVSRRQALWSLCGQRIVYLGTSLHMADVTKLIVSEYRRARALLYDGLLLGAESIGAIEPWRLVDDLDAEDYGGSWLTDERNADVLRGTRDALLRQIEGRADLRQLFLFTGERRSGQRDGRQPAPSGPGAAMTLCSRAMAAYEAEVQEFLQSISALLFVSPMPPLRASEFLSITATNSASRRRSMLLWERELMIHVRYRKTVEQTGKDGDNIRFVPAAISELVLTFLAVVQPLRLCFLRQAEPGALLSPYLFSKIDGTVWRDEMVSRCLSRACARAEVPEFKVAWWRQVAASITKEKFTGRERANFDLEELDEPEEAIEEEDLLVDLAESSNHSFRTFNHAYAGSTTLAMNTIMHRAHRASLSWRTLFRVDEVLAREMVAGGGGGGGGHKRPGSAVEMGKMGAMGACKKARTHAAEQVVAVLATGSGKTLIVMVAAVLAGAKTTILILPTLALRTNMMARFSKFGIKAMEWAPGELKAAPLVVVSAEAACTSGFLDYAHRLDGQQRLDRIVVDECHLTVTATFRKSMTQLGSYVRQIPTQTVWLTATLPPAFEEAFLRRNLLVRPRMVRESTNRANLRYSIIRYRGPGGLCDRAAELVRTLLAGESRGGKGEGVAGAACGDDQPARMIVCCPTLDLVGELAETLDCPMYTGDRETTSGEEKEAAIDRWLGPAGSPVIVATSALGVGFDHPNVRWVVHAGAPRCMTDFSQESGRAGRDGGPAQSVVLLSAAWQPHPPADPDEESMQLYLAQQHCLRAVMSQFLDRPVDWRWCMENEELCGVCPEPHTEPRPPGLPLTPEATSTSAVREAQGPSDLAKVDIGRAGDMEYTGPGEVLHRARLDDEVLRRFEASLEAMRGCCLLCRVEGGKPFDHGAAACSRRRLWIGAKAKTIRTCADEGKPWMAKFTACFICYLPQTICSRADPGARAEDGDSADTCRFRDMIMPLCYGAFFRAGPRGLIKKHFPRRFRDIDDYMRWLGEPTELGRTPCIQAIRVAEMLLGELQGA